MNRVRTAQGDSEIGRSEQFHRWRRSKDKLARWTIALGGVAVIWAVVLILFYLLWVVFPLFLPASSESHSLGARDDWAHGGTIWLSIEEQQEVGLRIDDRGTAEFFHVKDLETLLTRDLASPRGGRLRVAVEAIQGHGLMALGFGDGTVRLVRRDYKTTFEGGVENRRIEPALEFPFGAEGRRLAPGTAIESLAVSESGKSLVIAALSGGILYLETSAKQENFLTGEVSLDPVHSRQSLEFTATALAISGNNERLYVGDDTGRVHVFGLPGLEAMGEVDTGPHPVSEMRMLLGGISVLAGHADGSVSQLFPVRDEQNRQRLRLIRQFREQVNRIVRLQSEYRRRGFVALDDSGMLGIYHTTSGRLVLERELPHTEPAAIALSPRANGLLTLSDSGEVSLLELDNEHPEISWASLWRKVWYENYPEPQYVWQSSSASNDFEPKFSLAPLAFGTLKAALYAMLFAVPLALMGAAYTAYFMAPGLRGLVKPTIEIMAALPTVILGFLAGLWFAPFLEENLASVFAIMIVVPLGLLVFAYLWSRHSGRLRGLVEEGWEPVLLVPVIIVLAWFAMYIAPSFEHWLFGGDMRDWISQDLGISYDQRNALVVGVAMGFAVIPTIYSIAEDAVFGVPQTLSDGSLALGATHWQTLIRVVFPTASPGIFSGLMIGLGRAVGETMIVLMATGNTPIMDWNLFEGMRTLAANIAVEMPESEVNSSHYRILFLAALVLFVFTFVVNTGAEIVRQRLREKYSSL